MRLIWWEGGVQTKVDLTKCVENHNFQFDTVFDEMASNQEVYNVAIKPLVQEVVGDHGCMATAFARTPYSAANFVNELKYSFFTVAFVPWYAHMK